LTVRSSHSPSPTRRPTSAGTNPVGSGAAVTGPSSHPLPINLHRRHPDKPCMVWLHVGVLSADDRKFLDECQQHANVLQCDFSAFAIQCDDQDTREWLRQNVPKDAHVLVTASPSAPELDLHTFADELRDRMMTPPLGATPLPASTARAREGLQSLVEHLGLVITLKTCMDSVRAHAQETEQSADDQQERLRLRLHEAQQRLDQERALAQQLHRNPPTLDQAALAFFTQVLNQSYMNQIGQRSHEREPSRHSPAKPLPPQTPQRSLAGVKERKLATLERAARDPALELPALVSVARQAFALQDSPGSGPALSEQERFERFLAFWDPWQQALSRHPAYAAEVQALNETFASRTFHKEIEAEAERSMDREHIPSAQRQQASLEHMPLAAYRLMGERWQALSRLALLELDGAD